MWKMRCNFLTRYSLRTRRTQLVRARAEAALRLRRSKHQPPHQCLRLLTRSSATMQRTFGLCQLATSLKKGCGSETNNILTMLISETYYIGTLTSQHSGYVYIYIYSDSYQLWTRFFLVSLCLTQHRRIAESSQEYRLRHSDRRGKR